MFYILRTMQGRIDKHWGLTAIGVFQTEEEANAFARKTMQESAEMVQLLLVKAVRRWNITAVRFGEEDILEVLPALTGAVHATMDSSSAVN